MNTKYILAVLSVVFIALGGGRLLRDSGPVHPQSRTWLIIGGIFAIVSAWLFWSA